MPGEKTSKVSSFPGYVQFYGSSQAWTSVWKPGWHRASVGQDDSPWPPCGKIADGVDGTQDSK